MKDPTTVSGPKTKCVSTKLTDAEYAELEVAAHGHPLSAWAREALLHAARQPAGHPTRLETLVVAEVLALHAILLNLQFAVATGDPITVPRMQQLIARADLEKLPQAIARLSDLAEDGTP